MLTMHPTLLIGSAEWQAETLPKELFLGRIAALWRGVDTTTMGAIVYGDARHHAELAYLTHFTPKLEPALALIPRAGAPQLLVGGGVNMLAAARPLTWIADLLPLRQPGKTIAEWVRTSTAGGAGGRPVLIGAPAMPWALHREIADALGADVADATPVLQSLMRRKQPSELAAIRRSCATLDAVMATIGEVQRDGAGAASAVLAGELTAIRRGAQDVRSLVSIDGGRTLAPLDGARAQEVRADPLQVYVAVRDGGYWSEGFAALGRPHPAVDKACAALRSVLAQLQPGASGRAIADAIAATIAPYEWHPITAHSFVHAVGLDLAESPEFAADNDAVLAPGNVYSLRVGLSDGGAQCAIASAMVAVADTGCEILWSACADEGLGEDR